MPLEKMPKLNEKKTTRMKNGDKKMVQTTNIGQIGNRFSVNLFGLHLHAMQRAAFILILSIGKKPQWLSNQFQVFYFEMIESNIPWKPRLWSPPIFVTQMVLLIKSHNNALPNCVDCFERKMDETKRLNYDCAIVCIFWSNKCCRHSIWSLWLFALWNVASKFTSIARPCRFF